MKFLPSLRGWFLWGGWCAHSFRLRYLLVNGRLSCDLPFSCEAAPNAARGTYVQAMRRLRREDGMSFVELLTAVVIMGILAAVTYSTFAPGRKQFTGSQTAATLDASIGRVASWAGQAEGGEAPFAALNATVLQKLVRSAGTVETDAQRELPAGNQLTSWKVNSSMTQLTLVRCQAAFFANGKRLCLSVSSNRGDSNAGATENNAVTRTVLVCPTTATTVAACTKLSSLSTGQWPQIPASNTSP
jgi:prepilin-type N-terminal cleavage/methylation domain-containing protein